ncbi:MAG: thioesterase family protein [Actinomycetota bacterium]|nr:thioesterase family protein [Actinomycetota bacterium]
MSDAVFIPAGESPVSAPATERLVATDLARGPWDPRAQHGGAPAALIVRAFEGQPGGEELTLARVTYELLRPVPLGALEVSADIVRPGRRVQLLEATLRREDGVEVMRARALRVHRSDTAAIEAAHRGDGGGSEGPRTSGVVGPEEGRRVEFFSHRGRMFSTDAMDIRFISGSFLVPGPATAWFRLEHPLVAGEEASPLQRLAAAADFGNGISAVLPWDRYVFINPDLTIYLERPPVGEWFRLESETRLGRGGIGLSDSVLHDELGRVGRATQALLVTPRAE